MRAKFTVNAVTLYGGGSRQVSLAAVSAANAPDDPEAPSFWNATPSGTIQITVSNPAAAAALELGKSYYVDFSEATA